MSVLFGSDESHERFLVPEKNVTRTPSCAPGYILGILGTKLLLQPLNLWSRYPLSATPRFYTYDRYSVNFLVAGQLAGMPTACPNGELAESLIISPTSRVTQLSLSDLLMTARDRFPTTVRQQHEFDAHDVETHESLRLLSKCASCFVFELTFGLGELTTNQLSQPAHPAVCGSAQRNVDRRWIENYVTCGRRFISGTTTAVFPRATALRRYGAARRVRQSASCDVCLISAAAVYDEPNGR